MVAMTLGADRVHVAGEVRVPGDKSISHRTLLLGALTDGVCTLRGILRSGDTESSARVLRALGVEVTALGAETTVAGRGLRGLVAAEESLDCGNSGTTARLLLGILAAQRFTSTLIGDESLSRRPMRRVSDPLRAMGATIERVATHDGLPLTISGAQLRGVTWETPVASAQIKSAVLLAGVCGQVPVTVDEPHQSRDHTERMLASLGVVLRCAARQDGNAWQVTMQPPERLPAFELEVPGDPSSAAYFAALAAMADAGEVVLRGIALNPTRTGFLDVLRRMGASITIESQPSLGEPLGDVIVRPGPGLKGTTIEPNEVPALIDEIPLLACVAARADGDTTIRGASDLRVKESDRIAAIVSNLRAIGVHAEELSDGMIISGSATMRPRGPVRTFSDHRIAMAFATLGAAAGGKLDIDDPSCVAISYPDFWRDLIRVTSG
jgi:3-phosphoshikimate 1-carboxyvinyltransferase